MPRLGTELRSIDRTEGFGPLTNPPNHQLYWIISWYSCGDEISFRSAK